MKTIKTLAISAALLCSALVSKAQSMDDAVEKYSEAMNSAREQNFSQASMLLREAMSIAFDLGEEGLDITKEIQKQLPKMEFYGGISELKAGNFEAAIEQLSAASEMADLYGDITTMRQANRAISGTYQQQGIAAFNDKNYETALESFKKGYEQDPSNIKLSLLTAKSYAELGELEKAVEIYNTVVEAGAENSKFEDDATEAKKDIETYTLVEASKTKDAGKLAEIIAMAPQSEKVALMCMQIANNLKAYDFIIANAETAAALQTTDVEKSDIYFLLAVAQDNKGNKAAAKTAASKVTAGNNIAAAKAIAAK